MILKKKKYYSSIYLFQFFYNLFFISCLTFQRITVDFIFPLTYIYISIYIGECKHVTMFDVFLNLYFLYNSYS